MSETNNDLELKLEPFVSVDQVGLVALADSYQDLLESDVLLVRQESVPEIVETSRQLGRKIQKQVGPLATSETVTYGLIAISESERKTLEMARRVRPNILTKKQPPKYNPQYAS